MGSILHFLRAVDVAVQRRVDAAAFLSMRKFGWRKSSMKYWLFGLVIAASATSRLAWVEAGRAKAVDWPTAIMSLIVLLGFQHLMLWADRQAEGSPGTLSGPDRGLILFGPIIKVVFVGLIAWFLIRLPSKDLSGTKGLLTFLALLAKVSFVAIAYIAKTPYTPPPAKEKVSVLVPAPSEA